MPIFVPVETTAKDALKEMLSKMNEISKKYLKQLCQVYAPYQNQISNISDFIDNIYTPMSHFTMSWNDDLLQITCSC
jgi:hypothetical protein